MSVSVEELLQPKHELLTPAQARRAAHAYLDLGWAVQPGPGLDAAGECTCHLGTKCSNKGKHAREGWGDDPSKPLRRRTIRREEVDVYWSDDNWRDKPAVDQVFIVAYLSQLIVADIDDMNAWWALPEEQRPETLRQRSGSGRGEHWVYSRPWDTSGKAPAARGLLLNGAGEVRWKGIIAGSPSMHKSGGRYLWLNWWTPPAPAPEWMTKPRHADTGLRPSEIPPGWWADAMLQGDLRSARDLAFMPPGRTGAGRPSAIFAVAARLGRWIGAGYLDEATATTTLLGAAEANGAISDYGLGEIQRHIENGLRAGRTET